MEKLIESLVAGLGWEILKSCLLVGLGFVLSFLLHRPQLNAVRRDLEAMRTRLAESEAARTKAPRDSCEEDGTPNTAVDYIGACAIVDAYISPATRDMQEGTRITVRREFLGRFDDVTGAKLGEHEYNRALLHEWMRSNAARFLVDNRGKML